MTGILWYDTVICVLVFIFGSVIGSFLNVVIYRTPLHMSIVNGPSHCFSCGERIKPYDLVPIFSWIFLGGKCRKCKAPISARYTVVEALTGIMFLLAYIRFSASLPMVVAIVFFSLLIVLSCIDIDHMEIPYWCTISIAVLGIATFFTEPNMPWWEHFAGAAVIAVPFAILALFGGMGGGDVQLMAASGFVLGWKIVPSAVIGVSSKSSGSILHLPCSNSPMITSFELSTALPSHQPVSFSLIFADCSLVNRDDTQSTISP